MSVPTARDRQGAWTTLRRRKVVQWGISYGAGAWGLLQGIGFLADAFHWPDATKQVAALVLLIGLPLVLVLAWYHGDRGEQRVTRVELAMLALLFLLGGVLVWRYEHTSHPSSAAPTVTAAPSPAAPIDQRPSIAVLPFENRSKVEDEAFFVDGIHDDILTQLSKVSALKVISRTSVEQFRNTRLPTKIIAEQLGVKSILEGGVQRAGNRVRINVQLIDASTDAHLWAESYDRELTAANIFAIQSEVAAAIAGALQATLTAGERARVNAIPTQKLQAWEAYQLGKQRMARRTSAGLTESLAFFRKAVAADPAFALAYAGLADALLIQVSNEYAPRAASLATADEMIGKALALDPNLAEAHTSLAMLSDNRGDIERAEVEYRKAIELNPNYATAYHWYSFFLMNSGRIAEALQAAEKAVALDPLSAIINNIRAVALDMEGRFEEALVGYRKAIEIDPAMPVPYVNIAFLHAYAYGRFDVAVPFLEKAAELDPSAAIEAAALGWLYLALNDDAQAERWLNRATQGGAESSTASEAWALWHLYQGKRSMALAFARRSFAIDPRRSVGLELLRDADLAAGNGQAARARYAKALPELVAATPLRIDLRNYQAAIDFAVVLQKTGEYDRANELLDRSAQVIRTIPRMGMGGYWMMDAQIYALRGQKHEALLALRAAEKAGWRGPIWRYHRDFDPALASIRNDPEFNSVFADIERDMARQRAEIAARDP